MTTTEQGQVATLALVATQNAVNMGDTKETVRIHRVVMYDRAGIRPGQDTGHDAGMSVAIDARWYMGRSRNASKMYCSVWVRGKTREHHYYSGHGTAGGGGYDKFSASLSSALSDAGIALSNDIAGRGDGACREAYDAIMAALGYADTPYIVVE